VADEDQRKITIEFQEYHAQDLADLEGGASAIVDLKFGLDTCEGPLYVFLTVTKHTDTGTPQGRLQLDALTVLFTPGFWQKRTSLARKRRVGVQGGLQGMHGTA
jgi:hypothetical protein